MLELLQGQAIATPDSEVVEEKAAPKPCRSQTQKNTPINVDKLDDSHSKKEKAPIPLDELSKNPSKATQGSRSVSGVGSETEGETKGGGLPMDVDNAETPQIENMQGPRNHPMESGPSVYQGDISMKSGISNIDNSSKSCMWQPI